MSNNTNYEIFYDEADRNVGKGLDRNLNEVASVEQDGHDANTINITVIQHEEESGENLSADELRLFRSILDNAAKKYGFQANHTN